MTPLRVLVVLDRPASRGAALGSGTSLIAHDLLRHRPPHWEVTVVAADASPDDDAEPLAEDLRPGWRRRLDRLRLGAGAPFVSPAALDQLRRHAAASDVAYLHSPRLLRLAPLLAADVPVVLNAIDHWSEHLRRAAAAGSGRRSRLAAALRARRIAALERAATEAVRTVVLVSRADAASWQREHGGPVVIVANGVEAAEAPWRGADADHLVFVGSLDYEPNVESARILVGEVLPAVRAAHPGASVRLVGRRPIAAVRALAGPGVEIHADVPSVAEHLREAAVAVFPGDLGSGVRNSVLEALANGCPVVASPHAAREIEPGPHIVAAAEPAAVADAVVALLDDRDALRSQAARSRAFAASLPTPEAVARRYADIVEAAARG